MVEAAEVRRGRSHKKSICELVSSGETKAIVNVCTSPTINIMFHFGLSSLIYHLIKFYASLRAGSTMTGKMWRRKKNIQTISNQFDDIYDSLKYGIRPNEMEWKKAAPLVMPLIRRTFRISFLPLDFGRIDRPKQLELTLRVSDSNPKQCHHQPVIEVIKWSECGREKSTSTMKSVVLDYFSSVKSVRKTFRFPNTSTGTSRRAPRWIYVLTSVLNKTIAHRVTFAIRGASSIKWMSALNACELQKKK